LFTQSTYEPIAARIFRSAAEFSKFGAKNLEKKGNVTSHMKKVTNSSCVAFALFAFAYFALASTPKAFGVNPPPDGGYPGLNTAEGQDALFSLTTGFANTAVGWFSLKSNAEGSFNTATGAGALLLNTASENTAFGAAALLFNTTGIRNTASGVFSLYSNTTGIRNTANGRNALYSNTTGNGNTACGDQALYSNVVGSYHTAVGLNALYSNINGDEDQGGNTAIGAAALANNLDGGGATAVGNSALVNSVAGHYNIALGYVAGQNLTDGGNNIYIADPGVPAESNTIRIGNLVGFTDIYGFSHPAHTAAYIAGINGTTASGGNAVYVNSDGQLGTLTSSARFKDEIKPMDQSSEAILALKPVTFRYKHEIDPKGIPQFGLVAEEVEKVNPDLVVHDAEGKVYSVRYEAVNAMLLNEFLKEHQTVQELKSTAAKQEATIAALKSTVAQQQKGIETLTAGLQKVSAQLEASKPAPQVVKNNQGEQSGLLTRIAATESASLCGRRIRFLRARMY
jgi:uncharacterized coiled-coil protein SlyX